MTPINGVSSPVSSDGVAAAAAGMEGITTTTQTAPNLANLGIREMTW